MDRRLAQGLKTHKRKGASSPGSTKRARTEGTSSTVPAQVAITVDVPSDVEPEVPRAPSQSPPIVDPALEARPEWASRGERRRKKTLACKSRRRKAAVEGAGGSEEDPGENFFHNRDLIKKMVDGCILPEVVRRIVHADPEQRAWDSLGSFFVVDQFTPSSYLFTLPTFRLLY